MMFSTINHHLSEQKVFCPAVKHIGFLPIGGYRAAIIAQMVGFLQPFRPGFPFGCNAFCPGCNHILWFPRKETLSRTLAEAWAATGAPVFHHKKDGTSVPVEPKKE